jgi:intracellular septation protein A
MRPRVKSSLLSGLIGLLAFLVLVQGYHLLTEQSVGIPVAAGAALLVGVVATALSYVLERRLRANESP